MFQALFLCLLLLGTQGVGVNFFNYRKLAALSEGQTFKSCLDPALDQSVYFFSKVMLVIPSHRFAINFVSNRTSLEYITGVPHQLARRLRTILGFKGNGLKIFLIPLIKSKRYCLFKQKLN